MTAATTPYRVDTLTDAHGVYEERWMVPPPGERATSGEPVVFRVTAEAWVTERGEASRCSCEHSEDAHKWEPGFYDVRGHHAECTTVGCGCRRYQARPNPNCVGGRRRARVIHEWKAVEKRREL